MRVVVVRARLEMGKERLYVDDEDDEDEDRLAAVRFGTVYHPSDEEEEDEELGDRLTAGCSIISAPSTLPLDVDRE